MFWDRISRTLGFGACLALLMAVGATAQDTKRERIDLPQTLRTPEWRLYPPPTFLTPIGDANDGPIILQPPVPPGNFMPGPQVFWQRGDEPREAIEPSDHWVGLQCGRVSPALQAQLELDEDQGILVEAVVNDSPAAKAGIEKYDVLIQAGDRKLTKVQDLIDEVDKVKDGKLSIELIHKGKKKTLEVTPEKRPPVESLGDESENDLSSEWKDFYDYMQQWKPGKDGRPSMRFRILRQPGTIFPSPPKADDKLPDNVEVQIHKQGDKPAEIEVTRDGESWSVTENDLDKLPNDLRPYIERMLGRPRGPAGWLGAPPEGFKAPKPQEGREGILEKRFGDINRRFDRIEKSLEKLFDKGPEQPKEEPKAEPKPDAREEKPSGKEA